MLTVHCIWFLACLFLHIFPISSQFYRPPVGHFEDYGRKLVIKKQVVYMSDVMKLPIENVNCCKFIDVHALFTITIDEDFIRLGDQVQLSLIAPNIKVIGTRMISLDGLPANYSSSSVDRTHDGAPGIPGSAAGTVIFICNRLINASNLTISLNGGNGSAGRDGKGGINLFSETACPNPTSADEIPLIWEPFHAYEKTCGQINSSFTVTCYCSYLCKRLSLTLSQGGHGGAGGYGGSAGKLFLLVNTSDGQPRISTENGTKGADGLGGVGGIATTSEGGDLRVLVVKSFSLFPWVPQTKWQIFQSFHLRSNRTFKEVDGIDGYNKRGLIEPNKTELINASMVISSYKKYLLVTLSICEPEDDKKLCEGSTELLDFYFMLETNKKIVDLYDTLAYINELKELEADFYYIVPNAGMPLEEIYGSFYKRLELYNRSPIENESTDEYKKTRAHLSAAIYSKICALKQGRRNRIFVPTVPYLEYTKTLLTELTNQSIVDIIKNRTSTLRNSLNFQKQLYNDIDVDRWIFSLEDKIMTDVFNNFNESREQTERLKILIQERKLMNVIALSAKMKYVIRSISIIFLEAIKAQSTVNASLNEDRVNSGDIFRYFQNLNGILNEIKKYLTKNHEDLNDILAEMANKIKEMSSPVFQQRQTLQEIEKKISSTREKLKKNLANFAFHFDDIQEVYRLKDDLKQYLEDKVAEQRKRSSNLRAFDLLEYRDGNQHQQNDERKYIDPLLNILYGTDVSISLYKNIKNNSLKLEHLIAVTKECNDEIMNATKKENELQKFVLAFCNNVSINLEKLDASLKENRYYELKTEEWGILRFLTEEKILLHQKYFTKFSERENLAEYFWKLFHSAFLLEDAQQELSIYRCCEELNFKINYLSTDAARVQDKNLIHSMAISDNVTKTNLIWHVYQDALTVYYRLVYPCAYTERSKYYWFTKNPFMTPDVLGEDFSLLVEFLISNVQENSSFYCDEYMSGEPREYAHTEGRMMPFATWKFDYFKQNILGLLNGKITFFQAYPNIFPYTVKFGRIRLVFELAINSLQSQFDNDIENYTVVLTHLGDSFFDCGDDVYSFRSDPMEIRYVVRKNIYQYGNLAIGSNYKLSPHASWHFQIIPPVGKDINVLFEKYKNVGIDLFLEGFAIDAYGDEECFFKLKNYYHFEYNRKKIDD